MCICVILQLIQCFFTATVVVLYRGKNISAFINGELIVILWNFDLYNIVEISGILFFFFNEEPMKWLAFDSCWDTDDAMMFSADCFFSLLYHVLFVVQMLVFSVFVHNFVLRFVLFCVFLDFCLSIWRPILPGIGRFSAYAALWVCLFYLDHYPSLDRRFVYRDTKKPHPTANTTAVTATAGHIFGSWKKQFSEKNNH